MSSGLSISNAAASDIHASAVSVTHAEALACAYAARYQLEVTDVLEAAKALAASGDPTDNH